MHTSTLYLDNMNAALITIYLENYNSVETFSLRHLA